MDFDATAQVFKALGDPHRLKALHFIATADARCCSTGQGICTCDVQDVLGLAQPTTSHHMKILVEAGLVDVEKRGKNSYYTLTKRGLLMARSVLDRLTAAVPRRQKEAV
ncbi:ArsR/SmtB family transcription factor [Deinococcus peraridilitoris]|uniref:Putative transcriptional regulator n=1 Tax=Deinococcus peraridilitoris (strain DSM 19664 / LMG 22246 / CIP 109416 / KR-200) TaxID=937777 RepID=L0A0A5_DEIPD|nr:metalloregulator ArsR/SmtB family transcription factor [Deinococcus peraridilitoris]AFZ67323.1 putative transcriptional regulator [Deinococcus peraridilitoris DSM 19664]